MEGSKYEIRTANIVDVELIDALFAAHTTQYFGVKPDPPYTNLFYKYQTHRMIVYDNSDKGLPVAYCEVCIHPDVAVLSNDTWIQWLKSRFCIDWPVSLINTMFLNFYLYKKEDDLILEQVLMEIFYREHKLLYLIIVRPPNYVPKDYAMLENYGKIYYPIEFNISTRKNLATIVAINRRKCMPIITFRKALPEDNDDVIDMIDNEVPEMREEHGDFFIAELLLGTAGGSLDTDKIIVSEEGASDGSTGMMWLSEKCNVEHLVKNFELEAFGNLVSCTPDVPHGHVQFDVLATEQRHTCNVKPLRKYSRGHSVHLDLKGKNFLTERERVFTVYKHITDALHSKSSYLNTSRKILNITFDVIKKVASKSKKNNLNNASRAFVLKNFTLHPSLRLEHSFYYLCAMFSAYPEHDYCVVPVAPGTRYTENLTALLSYFIRVPHRPSCTMNDDIFVCHRSTINTELAVYALEKTDLTDIVNMLRERSSRQTHLISIVEKIAADVLSNIKSEFTMWIIRCGNAGRDNSTAIGFAILRPFTNYSSVYRQFLLPFDEDNLIFSRGEIVMMRLHPYFHVWSDEILRTIALKASYRDLFYFELIKGAVFPNDLTNRMSPVEPRRMRRNWFLENSESDIHFTRTSVVEGIPKVNCVQDEFYLYRHNLFKSRYMGDQTNLVIVGFSDICKAFLRLMIFGWNTPDFRNLNANNCLPSVDITVIVKPGEVEAEYDRDFTCNYCKNPEDCYLNRQNCCPFVMDTIQRLDLRNWIHFVAGKIEFINRVDKVVELESNCKIYYNKLLLLCDAKFGLPNMGQTPEHIKQEFMVVGAQLTLEQTVEQALLNIDDDDDDDSEEYQEAQKHISMNYEMPYNYAHINGRMDKMILYHKIDELVKSKLQKKQIVIYGFNLVLYECIDFLLRHGCKPADIICIQPHKIVTPDYLNKPTLDKNLDPILLALVIDAGIALIESANFDRFSLHPNTNFIEHVHFRKFPLKDELTLDCNLFINFKENYLPYDIERMLVISGIRVKDKRVMIDEDYHTNDPHIYAAGRHTEFFWEVFYQYTHVNESEVAGKLIDKLGLHTEKYSNERKYQKPNMFHCRLPMNYLLIKIMVPKRFMVGKLPNEYSHSMTTYDGDFCRVRMNPKLIVEEIVCVTHKVHRPLYFLEYFCGRHDTLLNNLRTRWKLGLIKSFISFFTETWTEYIMHDQFNEMQSRNRETLIALLFETHSGIRGFDMSAAAFGETSKHYLEANLLTFLRKYRKEFVNQFTLPEDKKILF